MGLFVWMLTLDRIQHLPLARLMLGLGIVAHLIPGIYRLAGFSWASAVCAERDENPVPRPDGQPPVYPVYQAPDQKYVLWCYFTGTRTCIPEPYRISTDLNTSLRFIRATILWGPWIFLLLGDLSLVILGFLEEDDWIEIAFLSGMGLSILLWFSVLALWPLLFFLSKCHHCFCYRETKRTLHQGYLVEYPNYQAPSPALPMPKPPTYDPEQEALEAEIQRELDQYPEPLV